ncbi:hypothetical protein DFH07DRAFT_245052 [Mycena maculata]|uniref:Uncharacterized protein n=1 Tax=Mycena maculata TaxID=230809 RepID=A0AAD7HRQ3_9AGAR|nr:hypothetical protein DFH07DRAFT_245052 [Mycena maculata]
MLRWLIGTQSFWVLIMATGEVFAFLGDCGIHHLVRVHDAPLSSRIGRCEQRHNSSGRLDTTEIALWDVSQYRSSHRCVSNLPWHASSDIYSNQDFIRSFPVR